MARGCFIFPYEKIHFGSDIVIYGAGNVGVSYVKQLLRTGYCNIVAWVDRDYKSKSNRYHEVESPDSINTLTYDYVVVAVNGSNLGLQIVRSLSGKNVPDEKIIFEEDRYMPYEESDLTLDDLLEEDGRIKDLIEDFRKSQFRGLDFFVGIFKDIFNIDDKVKENNVRDRLAGIIKEYLKKETNIESKEIAIRLFFDIRRFDKECMQEAIDTADKVKNPSKKYWLISNISLLEFMYPESVYDDFYTEKRKLLIDVNNELLKGRCIPQITDINRKRVVILAQGLYGEDETLTKFISMYANELAKTDYDIHIVLEEPLLYYYGEAGVTPYGASSKTSKSFSDKIAFYLNKKVKVHFADEVPLEDRHYSSICKVIELAPQVILDMCAKHSFLTAELYKHFPVICVSTGHNCNASLFHKYICRGKKQCMEINKRFHSVEEDQMVELPVGTVFPKAKYAYIREDYGFVKEDFLLVIVGRRLEKDISEELAHETALMMNKYPEMKLLLVGSKTDIFEKKYPELNEKKQIIPWGYEKDLPSLYEICDVFINPDRTGGGWSITWAIGEGLPVLSTDFPNDCTPLLGELVVHGGYPAIMKEIEKMYLDREYHTKWKQRTLDSKTRCSFSTKIEKLIDVCNEISDNFENTVLDRR
ncbi:MAG: glycosyltransferase [Lachnospiraceae bacterium]|nr:glycosyltransferase [Lachnospiraceae bacterium]